jgi:tyrosyl-tRNA synthetase
MLTFLPLEEIEKMEGWEGAQLNRAKEILGYELTKLVHGEEEAEKALAAARSLFGAGNASADMPTTELEEADFTDGRVSVINMMLKAKLASSRNDARTLIKQGGIALCDEKVTDMNQSVAAEDFDGKDIVVRKGKKVHHKFVIKK